MSLVTGTFVKAPIMLCDTHSTYIRFGITCAVFSYVLVYYIKTTFYIHFSSIKPQ